MLTLRSTGRRGKDDFMADPTDRLDDSDGRSSASKLMLTFAPSRSVFRSVPFGRVSHPFGLESLLDRPELKLRVGRNCVGGLLRFEVEERADKGLSLT